MPAVLPVVLQGAGTQRAVTDQATDIPIIPWGTEFTAPPTGVMLTVLWKKVSY